MATTFIYALCEPGTRTVRYIGMTNNTSRRLREHLCAGVRLKTHLGHWLRNLVASGLSPELIVLREVGSEFGPEAEMRFIRLARGCKMNLVNGTDGGEGVQNPSPETRAKKSAALTPEIRKKMSKDNSGPKNFFFGERHTLEARAKMSACNSGENNPMFGKTMSPESIAKIREKLKGRRRTEAQRKTMSLACLARPQRERGTNGRYL